MADFVNVKMDTTVNNANLDGEKCESETSCLHLDIGYTIRQGIDTVSTKYRNVTETVLIFRQTQFANNNPTNIYSITG
jgi:hypothetical protein